MTAGNDGRNSPTPDPSTSLLGRRNRYQGDSATGNVTARAYGAAVPDLAVGSDVRGERAAYPGHGTGPATSGSNSFFGLRLPRMQRPGAWYSPGGAGGAYGGGWADGSLTLRDRHVITRTGTTRSSNSPANGVSPVNPQADGPPRPEYQMVNTTESWQLGTDNTANQDNQGQHNTVPVGSSGPAAAFGMQSREYSARKVYPLGQQDGSYAQVFGPPLDTYRTYGARGPAGMHGPAPDIVDPNVRGSATVVVQAGAPGMQATDRRLVYGGLPHGLHSPTLQSTVVTGARFASTIQMTPPRVDRPASSKIAGQSYSQTIVPEAQQGQANQQPRLPNPGRAPGLRDRFNPRR